MIFTPYQFKSNNFNSFRFYLLIFISSIFLLSCGKKENVSDGDSSKVDQEVVPARVVKLAEQVKEVEVLEPQDIAAKFLLSLPRHYYSEKWSTLVPNPEGGSLTDLKNILPKEALHQDSFTWFYLMLLRAEIAHKLKHPSVDEPMGDAFYLDAVVSYFKKELDHFKSLLGKRGIRLNNLSAEEMLQDTFYGEGTLLEMNAYEFITRLPYIFVQEGADVHELNEQEMKMANQKLAIKVRAFEDAILLDKTLPRLLPSSDERDKLVEQCINDFGAYKERAGASIKTLHKNSRRPGGVGIMVEQDSKGLKISKVLEGFSAASAGLRAGDYFVSVDGEKDAVADLSSLTHSLIGDVGLPVEVEILRGGKQYQYTLDRKELNLPSAQLIENGYLYLVNKKSQAGDAVASLELGKAYYFGDKVTVNFRKSRSLYEQAAEGGAKGVDTWLDALPKDYIHVQSLIRGARKGELVSYVTLGDFYRDGDGVTKDVKLADYWYREAAEKGHGEAMHRLGLFMLDEAKINYQYKKSIYWLEKSAEAGVVKAQVKLGYLYTGEVFNLITNPEKAIYWLEKAAGDGDATAQYYLSEIYGGDFLHMRRSHRDAEKSKKWCRMSAVGGNAKAQNSLGYMLWKSQKYDEAIVWYEKSAKQGCGTAQFNLGICYGNGQGVDKSERESAYWHQEAAKQGIVDSQYRLGLKYYHGKGVAMDKKEAVKWYTKAALQGHDSAQTNLAFCYDKGEGVAEDKAEAVKLYKIAAQQGNSVAQVRLGICYYYGTGVVKDIAEARKCFEKAAVQGNELAKKLLKAMGDH